MTFQSASAVLIKPAKIVYAEVMVRAADSSQKDQKVTGTLVSYDDQTLTLKSDKGERELKWADLTPASAFGLRVRLIDKTKGSGWLELGRFGWSVGAQNQAKNALGNAVRMDPSLKKDADAILATPLGGPKGAATQASAGDGRGELIRTSGGPTTNHSAFRSPTNFGRPQDNSPKVPTAKYLKSTPIEDAEAIAAAMDDAAAVQKQVGVTFVPIQTDHFLLFTDWDPRDHDFLKSSLESAYSLVSDQFEIPSKENVFVGKLPVYMFNRFKDFATYTDSIGFLDGPTPRALQGYYEAGENGAGRLVMYKPSADDLDQARKQWAHSLVHEFTHAFIARYRTNARIPRWLNEGVAEVIAAKNFPVEGTYDYARWMAAEHQTGDELFNDDKMPGGEWYPVMQTMVELLVSRDRSAFLKLFDEIKAGTDGEKALKQFYGVDYEQFYTAWRQAVLHAPR